LLLKTIIDSNSDLFSAAEFVDFIIFVIFIVFIVGIIIILNQVKTRISISITSITMISSAGSVAVRSSLMKHLEEG
jgi:hypothetical protein